MPDRRFVSAGAGHSGSHLSGGEKAAKAGARDAALGLAAWSAQPGFGDQGQLTTTLSSALQGEPPTGL